MKATTSLIAAAATVLGLGGAAAAYQLAATTGPAVQPVSQTLTDDSEGPFIPEIESAIQFRWAPCKAPAVQRGRSCVTEVVNTVVLPATVSGSASSAGGDGGHQPAGGNSDADDDEQYSDDGDDDHGDDQTDDDTDDDGGDDHHDDDGEDEPGD